jgi:hypothetical protein
VTKAYADKHKKTTQGETIKRGAKEIRADISKVFNSKIRFCEQAQNYAHAHIWALAKKLALKQVPLKAKKKKR